MDNSIDEPDSHSIEPPPGPVGADPFGSDAADEDAGEEGHAGVAGSTFEFTTDAEEASRPYVSTTEPTAESLSTTYRPSPEIERVVRPIEPYPEPPAEPAGPADRSPAPYYAAQKYAAQGYAAQDPPSQSPPQHEAPSRWSLALLAFASGLVGAMVVLGAMFAAGVFDDEAPPPTSTTAPVATAPPQTVIVREVIPPTEAAGVATAVGQKVVPSIVTVEVGTGGAVSDFLISGSGSGVVISADGLIVTNNHVVQGATTSRVIFQDGRIYEATVLGVDVLTDLAVLSIEAEDLIPIEFGSTDKLQIGDRAIAIGNPLGLAGGASLTVGVVSAFDREVDTGNPTPLFGMLQTDAPITNGSSGGALVNAEGKLIGITTAIGVSQAGAEGIGFATPVEVVNRIVDQIIETGTVAHAFLGVSLRTNFTIQADGAAVPAGAIVFGFTDGNSAAEDAGLLVDDVILRWNGNDVATIDDLISGIRSASVGDPIVLAVERDDEILEFEVVLGQRPDGV